VEGLGFVDIVGDSVLAAAFTGAVPRAGIGAGFVGAVVVVAVVVVAVVVLGFFSLMVPALIVIICLLFR
jgi:hypothetical protein